MPPWSVTSTSLPWFPHSFMGLYTEGRWNIEMVTSMFPNSSKFESFSRHPKQGWEFGYIGIPVKVIQWAAEKFDADSWGEMKRSKIKSCHGAPANATLRQFVKNQVPGSRAFSACNACKWVLDWTKSCTLWRILRGCIPSPFNNQLQLRST